MSLDALLAGTYSASLVEVATLFCWRHFQDTAPPFIQLTYPEVELLVVVHAAQSASAHERRLSQLMALLVYVIPT